MQYLTIDNRTISTPLFDIIKTIREILHYSKLKDIKMRDTNIRITCPHHSMGQEHTPAADVYIGDSEDLEYGWYRCFVCGEQGPFYHFVAECFDATDDWAKDWLIENFSDGLIEKPIDIPEIILTKEEEPERDIHELDNMETFHPYLTQRKLTKSIIDYFNIKYDPETECVVFPVWDSSGKYIGCTRRNVNEKKFIIDPGLDKKNIYLLNYVKNKYKTCIITESQFNALTCWTYGMPAVALFGAGTPEKQIEELNKSGVFTFILMYDNDSAGKSGSNKFQRLINKNKLVYNITMPYGKDVNDLTEQEFYDLLKQNDIELNHIVNI